MADHDERSPLLGSSNNDGLEPNQRIDDQEIQRVRSRDSPQYEGLPEVKKNLRWIVPAVAIGASFPVKIVLDFSHAIRRSNHFLYFTDIPLSCGSDHSSKFLRHNWQ